MFIPAETNIKHLTSTDAPLSSMTLCSLAYSMYDSITDGRGFINLHSFMQMIQSEKERFWNT